MRSLLPFQRYHYQIINYFDGNLLIHVTNCYYHMVLAIDAINVSVGGGLTHLIEILKHIQSSKLERLGIESILLIGQSAVLIKIENKDFITKIDIGKFGANIFLRVLWQKFHMPKIIAVYKCNIVYNLGGSYYNKNVPYVTMSRNMLVFEKKEADRYHPLSWIRIRLRILNILQTKSFNSAAGMIFISQYAQKYITRLPNISIKKNIIIHHGISNKFNSIVKLQQNIRCYTHSKPYKMLYVSILDVYKHQDKLVEAVNKLNQKGYDIELILVGAAYVPFLKQFQTTLSKIENHEKFIKYLGQINYNEISKIYKDADLFVFASSCENMPNILIEAMSAGLPIACSNYGPMPEFLKDAGEYFDPLDVDSTTNVIEKLLLNPQLRYENAIKSYNYAKQFSWEKCANETLEFIADCYQKQCDSKNYD